MARNNNANRNQGGGAGSSQAISINVSSAAQNLGDKVEIAFEVSVFKGASPVANQRVVLMDNLSMITQANASSITGTNGIAMLKVEIPLTDKEYQKMLRVSLDGRPETFAYPVMIPAKAKSAASKNAAAWLIAMKYQASDGRVEYKIRLLKHDGDPVKDQKVSVWFKGCSYNLKTDDLGETLFSGITLSEGDTEEIVFTTPGIVKELKMTLRRRETLNQPRAFTAGWWLGVNNGRAFLILCAALILWFLAFSYGPGSPVAGESLFNGDDGLSAMERYYNETADRYGRAIAPTDDSNDFIFGGTVAKKKIWIWALLLTVAFVVYFPIAAREEIAEAIDEIKLKLIDRSIVKVGDPFFEKIVATATTIGLIGNSSPGSVEFGPVSSSTAPHPDDLNRDGKKDKKGFGGGSFWSFLSLDLLGDLVIGVVKRIFLRN